jgi:hypothetical protein
MDSPFIKTELIGSGEFDFWRKKLYELRESIYKRMETDGKCPICLESGDHKECGFADIETAICSVKGDAAPMPFWKEKLDELRKVIDEAGAEDAICPVCLGSWSCNNDCERKRIEIEIKEHKEK